MKNKLIPLLLGFVASTSFAGVTYTAPQEQKVAVAQTQVTSYRPQQGVHFAPVVDVQPVHHAESYSEVKTYCTPVNVPVYRSTPVVEQYHHSGSNNVLGTVVGAVVGVALTKGTNMPQAVGGIIGAGVGNEITKERTTTRIVGYNREIVGYEQRQNCERVNVPMQRMVVIGYNVTYDDNGVLKNIVMTRHPGQHVRLVTTTSIQ